MTGPDGASAPPLAAARTGPVLVHPADGAAPAVRALRSGFASASPNRASAAAGDHVLNPHLAPDAATPPARHAAVLIAIGADERGTPSLILTERAAHLPRHAGQIAFPGGRIEAAETATEAALREAHEEVDLPPDAVEVIGATDTYLTRTGFLVFPVVALVRRAVALTPDPGEVAVAFTAPWDYVMDRANHQRVVITGDGPRREYFEIRHGERRIWGVTAGILRLVRGTISAP